MSLLIDDPETVAAIEALADSKKLSVADAVKDAITNEQLRVAQHAERLARRAWTSALAHKRRRPIVLSEVNIVTPAQLPPRGMVYLPHVGV